MSFPATITVKYDTNRPRWSLELPPAFGLYYCIQTTSTHVIYRRTLSRYSESMWVLKINTEYPYRHVLYFWDSTTNTSQEVFERIGVENYIGAYTQCDGMGSYTILVAEAFVIERQLKEIPFPAKYPPNVDKLSLQRISDWFGEGKFVNAWFSAINEGLIYRLRYYPLIKKIGQSYIMGKDLTPGSSSLDLYQYFFNSQDAISLYLKPYYESDYITMDDFPLYGGWTEFLCSKYVGDPGVNIQKELVSIFGGSEEDYIHSDIIGGGFGGIIEIYSNETTRPAPGILCHWRFDSIKEGEFFDSAGMTKGVLIDPYNSLKLQTGRISKCIYRPATAHGETGLRLETRVEDINFGDSSFTIAGWFKTTSPLVYLYDQKDQDSETQVSIRVEQGSLYFTTKLGSTVNEIYTPNAPERIVVSGITNPSAANGTYYRTTSTEFTTVSGVHYDPSYPIFKHSSQEYYLWYGEVASPLEKYIILNGPVKTNDDDCFYYMANSVDDFYTNLSLTAYGSFTGNCTTTYYSAEGQAYNDGQWRHFACILERDSQNTIPRIIIDGEQVAYSITEASSAQIEPASSVILSYCQGYQIEQSEIVQKPTFALATGEQLSDFWQTEGSWQVSSDSEGNFAGFSHTQPQQNTTASIEQNIPLLPNQLYKINTKIKMQFSATGSKVDPNDPNEPEVAFPKVVVKVFIGATELHSIIERATPQTFSTTFQAIDQMLVLPSFSINQRKVRVVVQVFSEADTRVTSCSISVKAYQISLVPYVDGELAVDDIQIYKRVLDKNDVLISSGQLLPRRECAEGYPLLPWDTCAHPNNYTLSGNGTEQSPYLLCSKQNIIQLSQSPQDWHKVFSVTANINMGNTPIQPIGGTYIPVDSNFETTTGQGTQAVFCGKIYGNNRTIRNVVVKYPMLIGQNSASPAISYNRGFFGHISALYGYYDGQYQYKIPRIKDLTLENIVVHIPQSGNGAGCFAGHVYTAYGNLVTEPMIENCHIKNGVVKCLLDKQSITNAALVGSVNSVANIGGFVGYASCSNHPETQNAPKIKDCTVTDFSTDYDVVTYNIQTHSFTIHPKTDLFVWWYHSPFNENYDYWYLKIGCVISYVGGFVGNSGFTKILNCKVKTSNSSYLNNIRGTDMMGGFCGHNSGSSFIDCEAKRIYVQCILRPNLYLGNSSNPPDISSAPCLSTPSTIGCGCGLDDVTQSSPVMFRISPAYIGGFVGLASLHASSDGGFEYRADIVNCKAEGMIESDLLYQINEPWNRTIGGFAGQFYITSSSLFWDGYNPIPGSLGVCRQNVCKVKQVGVGLFRLFGSLYGYTNSPSYYNAAFNGNVCYRNTSLGYDAVYTNSNPSTECAFAKDDPSDTDNVLTGYKTHPGGTGLTITTNDPFV